MSKKMTGPARKSVDNLHRVEQLLIIAQDYLGMDHHRDLAQKCMELYELVDKRVVRELKEHAQGRAKEAV